MVRNNRGMRFFCAITIVSLFSIHSLAHGQDLEPIYGEFSAVNVAAEVTVNGFPCMHATNKGVNVSRLITPYLRSGKNQVEVLFSPTSISDETSFVSASIGKRIDAALPLCSVHIGSRTVKFREFPTENVQVLYGSLSGSDSPISFSRQDTEWRWGFTAITGKLFDRVPSRLAYEGLNCALRNVRIYIRSRANGYGLVFSVGNIESGNGKVELTADKIVDGQMWAGKRSFDTIIIAADANTKPIINFLSAFEIQGAVIERRSFDIQLPFHWSWEKAKEFDSLAKEDTQQLTQLVLELHDALSQKNVKHCVELFKNKAADIAKVTGKDFAFIEGDEVRFFESAFARPDWAMTPIDPTLFQFRIINKEIVKAEDILGQDLIRSVNLKQNNGRGDGLVIPLYFAYFDGKWNIVR